MQHFKTIRIGDFWLKTLFLTLGISGTTKTIMKKTITAKMITTKTTTTKKTKKKEDHKEVDQGKVNFCLSSFGIGAIIHLKSLSSPLYPKILKKDFVLKIKAGKGILSTFIQEYNVAS